MISLQSPVPLLEGWQLGLPDAHPRLVPPDLRQLEIATEVSAGELEASHRRELLEWD
jgi:hypothetical protein